MLPLNEIGKQIFWMQQTADFFLKLEYVRSDLNVADKYTRQSPGLEASISEKAFQRIVNRMGPFQWDLMASTANVNRGLDGKPLKFFSRYYDQLAAGINVFSQDLSMLKGLFCFPPTPMISMFLSFLQSQKLSCVVVVPRISASWYNLLQANKISSFVIAEPFDNKAFSISSSDGKRVPKVYKHAMIAVLVSFI